MSTKWTITTATAGTFLVNGETEAVARQSAHEQLVRWGCKDAAIVHVEAVAPGEFPAYRNINLGRITA